MLGKHSSLVQYGTTYSCKIFNNTVPEVTYCFKLLGSFHTYKLCLGSKYWVSKHTSILNNGTFTIVNV
jgi:hypothetical protein